MAKPAAQFLLSPAELSFLHDSLCLTPPVRPDGRTSNQFRPLIAETGIVPSANGSSRVCFADGTEAIVGVKAEVAKSRLRVGANDHQLDIGGGVDDEQEDGDHHDGRGIGSKLGVGEVSWVEMSIEVPGFRDDDALPVFLSAMLTEALVADGKLKDRLWINRRFHWKLYIDILLLSAPSTYPLPLLSMATHLALLSARLPKLKSEGDEDPLFDDDWEASTYLYPYNSKGVRIHRPPITLLVMSVGSNFIFDPSKDELAVAEAVVAVSAGMVEQAQGHPTESLRLLSLRTIDPPSRSSPPGLPNALNHIATGAPALPSLEAFAIRESNEYQGVWNPPRGGMKRAIISQIIKAVLEPGGAASEVMEGLINVET